jgi:hypothetical protein
LLCRRPVSDGPVFIHAQRYRWGHDVRYRRITRRGPGRTRDSGILAEVVRLDHVLSHFDPESDLSRLVRRGRGVLVTSIRRSTTTERVDGKSRRSRAADVTVGPLVRVWQTRRPAARRSAKAITGAGCGALKKCSWCRRIASGSPDCVSIDLGGRSHVERAPFLPDAIVVVNAARARSRRSAVRRSRRQLVDLNVDAGPAGSSCRTVRSRRHARSPAAADGGVAYGDITDPARAAGRVVDHRDVCAASATQADVLSTTLLR